MQGWLGKDRMTELLDTGSFVCHKNTDLQCAGHMLIKGLDNQFVRLAEQWNEDLKLKGRELVFKTVDECIAHHATDY